jgi:hypothetical protein
MTWEQFFEMYEIAGKAGDHSRASNIIQSARKLVSDRSQRDWLRRALEDVDRMEQPMSERTELFTTGESVQKDGY